MITTPDEPLFHSSEPRVLAVPRGTVRPGYADRAAMDLDQMAPTPTPVQRAPPVGPKRAIVPDLPPLNPDSIPKHIAEKVARKVRIPLTVEQIMMISEPVRNALASTFNTIDESAKQPASSRLPAAIRNLSGPPAQTDPPPRVFRSATTSLEDNPETLIFKSAAINPQSSRTPHAWSLVGVDAEVNGAKVDAVFLDCGAQINVMNADTAARLGLLRNCGPGMSFRGVGSSSSMSLGSCIANITIGDLSVEQEFVIVQEDPSKDPYAILLGLPWLHATNAVLDFKAMEVTMEKVPNIRHVVPLRPHGRNHWAASCNPKMPYSTFAPSSAVKSYPTSATWTDNPAIPIKQPCLPSFRDLPGMVDIEVTISTPSSTDPLRAFALIDTGSMVNTISLELATKIGATKEMFPTTITTINGVGDAHLPVIGLTNIRVQSGRALRDHPFLIINSPSNDLVLGTPWLYTMGAVLDFRRMCMVIEVHAIQPTPPSMLRSHVATAWQTLKLHEHQAEDDYPWTQLMRVNSTEAFNGPEEQDQPPDAQAFPIPIPIPSPLFPIRSPFEAATDPIPSDPDPSSEDDSTHDLETDSDAQSTLEGSDRSDEDDSDSDLSDSLFGNSDAEEAEDPFLPHPRVLSLSLPTTAPSQAPSPTPPSARPSRSRPPPSDQLQPSHGGTLSIQSSPAHKRARFGPEASPTAPLPVPLPSMRFTPLFGGHTFSPGQPPAPRPSLLPSPPPPSICELQPSNQPFTQLSTQLADPDMDLTPPGSPSGGGGTTRMPPETPRKPGPYAAHDAFTPAPPTSGPAHPSPPIPCLPKPQERLDHMLPMMPLPRLHPLPARPIHPLQFRSALALVTTRKTCATNTLVPSSAIPAGTSRIPSAAPASPCT